MQDIHDIYLVDRFPRLLAVNRYAEPRVFGFECGDGWLGLLEGTFFLLDHYASQHSIDLVLTQVKEKFGSLRVYSRGGDKFTELVVDMAELVSSNICDVCGGVGEAWSNHGWICTRCSAHQLSEPSRKTIRRAVARTYAHAYSCAVAAMYNLLMLSATRWVQEPSTLLGGRKPCEALGSVEGCREILLLIRRMEHGVVG